MRKFKRLTMTLALLIMAVGGAWAQSTLNVMEFAVPADWASDNSNVTAADLPGFKASTLEKANAWTGAPKPGMAVLVYAFDGNTINLVLFSNGEPNVGGSKAEWTKKEVFGLKSNMKFYYTTEPTEWPLTSQDGKTWTLDKMPANDVELQVEYFAESNLFLSKDALADKASIAVKAGDLGVQFGEDGKSANTITEGTTMTVTYTGSKKVIGVKVEKKGAAAPEYADKLTEAVYEMSKWNFSDGPNADFTGQELTAEQAIALAQYQAAQTGKNCAVFYGKHSSEWWTLLFAKSDGTTGSGDVTFGKDGLGLSDYDTYYVAK